MEQAQRYFELRKQKEEAEAVLDRVKEELHQVERDLVMWMENSNLQSFKDVTHGTIYLREQVYARIDNEAVAFNWFEQNDMGDVIKRTVHNKTLCAIAKTTPDIPGIITTYETRIGYRKAAS